MKLIDKVKKAANITDDNLLLTRCPKDYGEPHSLLCIMRDIDVPAYPTDAIHGICWECWNQEVD